MIWVFINTCVRFFIDLFVPPPPQIRQIDDKAPCPNCGHRDGKLTAVKRDNVLLCQHDCKVCRAQWWEPPVLAAYEKVATSSTLVKVDAPPAPPKE